MEHTEHIRFRYDSLDALRADIERLGLDIPLQEDLSILKQPLELGSFTLQNRMCVLPMEGCDSTEEGAPTDLVYRRYHRFGAGGAGTVWVEANTVVAEGRANPRQLFLNPSTLDGFAALTAEIDCAAREAYPGNAHHHPYKILQLTHSGRYARPEAVCMVENPVLDPKLPPQHRVITDDELRDLIPAYVNAAVLAKRAGFDAVDVKACHGYLFGEMLGAWARPGEFGGNYEGRTRLIFEIIDRILDKTGGLDITMRLNAFDAADRPYGWGVDANDGSIPDLEEPIRFLQQLQERNVKMIGITVGNPYYCPHYGRPYDVGYYKPRSHQLQDVARVLHILRDLQAAAPDIALISTGMSWLREYAANIAAAAIEKGWFRVLGLGRQSLAYPDFARDIVLENGMKREKCCVACTSCTTLMRGGQTSGCPVRDKELYGPKLQAAIEKIGSPYSNRIGDHV